MNHWSVLRLLRMLPGPKPHNPYFDAAKRHHTPVGFRNNHPRVPATQEELARLHRDLGAQAPLSAPQVDLSEAAPDLALLQANRTRHTVTGIGHSTVLVQTGGRNLITDPMFSRRASPLPFAGPRRHQPPGIALRVLQHFRVFEEGSPRLLVGFAATPKRGDGKALGEIFQDIAFTRGLEEMIRQRYLSGIVGWRVRTEVGLDNVKIVGGDS